MNKENFYTLLRAYFSLIIFLGFPISVIVSLVYSIDNMYIGHLIYNTLKILLIVSLVLLIGLIIKYVINKK